MDKEFLIEVRTWLDTPMEQRDNTAGAMLLLRANRNRIMYANIIRHPDAKAEFIEYQLRKRLNFLLDGLTHEEVEQMQTKVDAIVIEHGLDKAEANANSNEQITINNEQLNAKANAKANANTGVSEGSTAVGKRSDHDSLPDKIKALYVENLSILRKMRELHLQLRQISRMVNDGTACPDSDRYPFLKELIALDKKYHENWKTYDHFGGNAELTESHIHSEEIAAAKAAKKLQNLKRGRKKKTTATE